MKPNHHEKFKIMKTHFEKSVGSRRANCPKTKSRPLGHAIWLAVLLAHLCLTSGQAAPEVTAWGLNASGQRNVPSGLSNVMVIAAVTWHSLALTVEGRVVGVKKSCPLSPVFPVYGLRTRGESDCA